MARRPATDPRKQASQARSRATVDALIEATVRILVRDGFDRASTNRIAAEAGVSVGSLYQYFPGKEALVAAVIARHSRDLIGVARAAMDEVVGQPIAVGVRRLVAAAIAAHSLDPALHRVLAEQTPRTAALLADVDLFDGNAYGLFRSYLAAHRDELGAIDLDRAAFICVTSIEALTHTAVLNRPDMLTDAALIDDTARMVLGYLVGAAPGVAQPA